jgi:hypothetical protein
MQAAWLSVSCERRKPLLLRPKRILNQAKDIPPPGFSPIPNLRRSQSSLKRLLV